MLDKNKILSNQNFLMKAYTKHHRNFIRPIFAKSFVNSMTHAQHRKVALKNSMSMAKVLKRTLYVDNPSDIHGLVETKII